MINRSNLEFSLKGNLSCFGTKIKNLWGSGKFKAMWLGPYVVSKFLSKGTYELADFDGNKLPKPRNGLYLKKVLCLGLALFLVFSCMYFYVH